MTLGTWVQEFQTLTVGILGFLGVTFTLWCNARQAREQHRAERQHECQTLRVALIEELKINRGWLTRNTEKVIKESINDLTKEGGYFVPTDAMEDAYRAFTHRIGLLSQLEVAKVMGAYLSLRSYNARLFLISIPLRAGDRHVQVLIKHAQLHMQETLIRPIDEAIGILERAYDNIS
jgi:hypothetical protein